MILLVLIASVLIAGVTIYQYREQSKDYHQNRLERKEEQILQSINYVLKETTFEPKTENLEFIFRNEIYKISDVQNVNFNIYDLEGTLIKSSKPDNSFNDMELREFLIRLGGVYLVMLLSAILLAYFISKYITRSLQNISDKIGQTNLNKRNEKIIIQDPGEEIGKLVDSYNAMIDELEESAAKLARSEREQAWREMAKQVAHEIKNPLTPMRLTVQSFERKFSPNDSEAEKKIKEFSKSLVQQIDTMSNIASAFSNFADMPAQQKETLNVVKVSKLALDIFHEPYIHFLSEEEELIAKLDKTQLIRVILAKRQRNRFYSEISKGVI